MLCDNCHKKEAIMHMVCLAGEKQIDKWLCADCAKEYMPKGIDELPLTADAAKRFFETIMQSGGARPKKKITREGFSEAAAKVLELATSKALDAGSDHIGTAYSVGVAEY